MSGGAPHDAGVGGVKAAMYVKGAMCVMRVIYVKEW